jgi:hypothetical protein
MTSKQEQDGSLESVKNVVVEQWKKNFTSIRTLQVAAQAFSLMENAALVNRKLIISGESYYDAPKFCDIIRVPSEHGTIDISQTCYDGKYYYYYSSKSKNPAIRSLSISVNRLALSMNPLYGLYSFVVNDTQPKNFDTLTNVQYWDALKERIVSAGKQKENFNFVCESRDSNNKVKGTYDVEYTVKNNIFFPISIITRIPNMPDYSKCEVTKTNDETIANIGIPFPSQLTFSIYHYGVVANQSVSETQPNTLKINQPVNPKYFVITPKDGEEIKTVESL